MKYRVLVSSRSMQLVLDRFRGMLEKENIELVVPAVVQRLREAELFDFVRDVDGVLAGDDFFTERVLRNAQRLKVIAKWGTGLDSIDLNVCRELGIKVVNTPGAFTVPVADSTLGYVLLLARGLQEVDRDIRAGVWRKYKHRTLRECTLGIIGVGRIGKAVARRAQTFGMSLLGNDPMEMSEGFIVETGISMVGKDQLLTEADFVVLHCDLNETSRDLIGRCELELMKSGAYLLNLARGGVVEEEALIEALQRKKIAGAVLDVFKEEPLPKESEFFGFENVWLSPHCANSSPVAYEKVYENTINGLLEGLKKHENARVHTESS